LIYNIYVMKKILIQCLCIVAVFGIFFSCSSYVLANDAPFPLPQGKTVEQMSKEEKLRMFDPRNELKSENIQCQDGPCTKTTYWYGFIRYKYPNGVIKYYYGTGFIDDENNDFTDAAGRAVNQAVNDFQITIKEMIYNGLWAATKAITFGVGVVGEVFDKILVELTPTSEDSAGSFASVKVSIEPAWKIIRDVASILLIFSLLYLGIKTILDANGFADRKTLISIIVAAILLNFSLLLVRDVAFFVSNRIGQEILKTAVLENTIKKNGSESFSAAMINMIGPQSLFKTQNGQPDASQRTTIASDWEKVFMFVIQFFILLFVLGVAILIFVMLTVLLITRFVIFVILMIAAPLGIIASSIPWLKGYGKQWWDELKKQTIFFPAFVFIMYIIFLIVGTLGSGAQIIEMADFSDGLIDSFVTFFLNFALIIGFLLVLLVAPGKLSQGGSEIMGKVSGWTSGKVRSYAGRTAGAVTFGTGAMLGRNTVGRGATRVLSSDKIKLAAQNPKGLKGMAARALLRGSDKAQDMSFDPRNTKLGGSLASKYNLGTASKGWKSTVEEKSKSYKEKMDKEKKLFGIGEDLPNASKTRGEIKNMQIRDTLQKSIEEDRKEITRLQGSTKSRDIKKAQSLAAGLNKKEEKLVGVYTNLDKFEKDRVDAQGKQKEDKQAQIDKAQKLLQEQRQKTFDMAESGASKNEIKVQEEAIKIQEKALKELQTEHNAIGVNPKQRHAQELSVAKATRDNTAKELKAAQKELEEAVKNKKDVSGIMKKIGEHEKSLGEYETEVGRLMNKGADQALKFAESRSKIFGLEKSRASMAARENVAKDIKKEWREKGQASQKQGKKEGGGS
jgi:hypothetical protein